MRLKALASILLSTTLVTQLAACGTVFYPERRGQISGEIDPGVAILNGIGLLFYVIPVWWPLRWTLPPAPSTSPTRAIPWLRNVWAEALDDQGAVDPLKPQGHIAPGSGVDLPMEQAVQVQHPRSQPLALLNLPARG